MIQMKLRKLNKLSLEGQVDYLHSRSNECIIPLNDNYLNIYPCLVTAISKLPLDEINLALIGSAVFGWMPTQLYLQKSELDIALRILTGLKDNQASLNSTNIQELANIFQTIGGKSVVSASKLLHFVYPKSYPIWDRRVAKKFGLSANGAEAAENYFKFLEFCRIMAGQNRVKQSLQIFQTRLKDAGYTYQISPIRLIELLLYLE